jgi:signal transduction histidine kinase
VIGASILVAGVLLVLTALASTRIPGGATFARPGITDSGAGGDVSGGLFAFARRGPNPIRAFALSPIHPATWYANGGIVLGVFVGILGSGFILSFASAGLTVLLAGVGVVIIAMAIEASRLIARLERWRAFVGEPVGAPPPHPYRPLRGNGIIGYLRAQFLDESRWRDVVYVVINLPLSIIEFFVVTVAWWLALSIVTTPIWYDAVAGSRLPGILGPLAGHDPASIVFRAALGAALLPVAASMSQLVMALHRGVVGGLLCTSESRELRRQLEATRRSRSAVLDVEASELRRIERDLHDGAQQRLVMLSIDLGLASERVDTDPEGARQLILEGQEQARAALAEIRQLVRGIAPSILLDRGLVAALESVAGHGPVETIVSSDLAPGERLPTAAERAAYFVATEALANVAKHSGAGRCEIHVRREGDHLVVEVQDDGVGGAHFEPGGGLAGLQSRVAGVDGTLTLTSPPGGPTVVRAEIPL